MESNGDERHFLKKGVTAEEVQVYLGYIERLRHEYDLIWGRFKVYLGLCSSAFVAGAYAYVNSHQEIAVLVAGLGMLVAHLWVRVEVWGRYWMKNLGRSVADLEACIIEDGPLPGALQHRLTSGADLTEGAGTKAKNPLVALAFFSIFAAGVGLWVSEQEWGGSLPWFGPAVLLVSVAVALWWRLHTRVEAEIASLDDLPAFKTESAGPTPPAARPSAEPTRRGPFWRWIRGSKVREE